MKPANRNSLYGRQWQKARKNFLTENPLCAMCREQGRLTAATVVNHNPPHGFDPERFWDVSTWQPLCQPHHDSTQQRYEKTGRMPGCDANGAPTDPRHTWRDEFSRSHRRGQRWGYSIPDGIRRSAVPVHLVCGPPGSGKSTYAAQHAGALDTVIDVNDIRARLGFHPHTDDRQESNLAFAERAKQLHALAYRQHGEAWLVVGAPTDRERRTWREALGNVTVHAMDTPADECKRRIMLDPKREGYRQHLCALVDDYFQKRREA